MTTSRGVTIMKKVTSATCLLCNDERALADLVAPVDLESCFAKEAVHNLRRMERVDRRHLRWLRLQMLPTFGGGRINVVHDRVSAGLQSPCEIARVQPDHPELQLHKRVG